MTGTKLRLAATLIALAFVLTPAFADERSGISVAEFGELFKQLDVKNQRWASIPWKSSVTEARKVAAREKKPIFFNVNTGNCLGFT
jgi:hypothetical protein